MEPTRRDNDPSWVSSSRCLEDLESGNAIKISYPRRRSVARDRTPRRTPLQVRFDVYSRSTTQRGFSREKRNGTRRGTNDDDPIIRVQNWTTFPETDLRTLLDAQVNVHWIFYSEHSIFRVFCPLHNAIECVYLLFFSKIRRSPRVPWQVYSAKELIFWLLHAIYTSESVWRPLPLFADRNLRIERLRWFNTRLICTVGYNKSDLFPSRDQIHIFRTFIIILSEQYKYKK